MKKSVKKWLKLMLAGALTASILAGCGGTGSGTPAKEENAEPAAENTASAETSGGDLLAKIQKEGKIVIAMEGNWAPWTYEDESGNLVGFEVEVSGAVAEKLGVTPEYVTGEWDGLLAGVQAGRYDVMANGVGYTDERAQAYYYSDFYAFNRTVLVVRGPPKNTVPPSKTWSPLQERSMNCWQAVSTRLSMRKCPLTTT